MEVDISCRQEYRWLLTLPIDEAAAREQSTEQLTLALDALTFHVASLSDRAYPRIGVISLLIEMVRKQSALRRGAAETLVAVGETIAASAEAEEQLTGTGAYLCMLL